MRAYLVRHGQHKDNVLTPAGVARMMAAAEAIRIDAEDSNMPTINFAVYASQEPRAVMSAGVIAATLGIKVTGLPLVAFNPAGGLGKAITEGRLPQPGQGCIKAMLARKERTCDGVEEFAEVKRRALTEMATIGRFGTVVIATHGGVVEPCVDGMSGSDLHDMVEGEVAVVETYENGATATVRFLNGTLPT